MIQPDSRLLMIDSDRVRSAGTADSAAGTGSTEAMCESSPFEPISHPAASSTRGLIPSAHRRSTLIAAGLLIVFAAVIWLPAVGTPFWGDDYAFLQGARAANAAGAPWWSAFVPSHSAGFWRPFSQDLWWRFVDDALAADPRLAHWANLGLLLLAAGCTGILGWAMGCACAWPMPRDTAILGGAIYAVLALHLLPVHWAAAANSSILVALTSLILAAWIAAPRAGPVPALLMRAAIPLLMALALLSKESAALIPVLMVVLMLYVGRHRFARAELTVWLVCAVMVGLWLLVTERFSSTAGSGYDIRFGANLLRNGAALLAWLFNVPREALRLVASGQVGLGLLWATACALPMMAVWVFAMRSGLRRLGRKRIVLLGAFCVLAYAPYFALAWNSYAYYAAVAATLPALLLARGLAGHRHILALVLLVGVSSGIAVEGSRELEAPGLIGRARWAEATLQSLRKAAISAPLEVRAGDPRRFYAIGIAGLEWRLGLSPGTVHAVDSCTAGAADCLSFDERGRYAIEYRGPAE